jgi:hypothetical protein
MRFWVISASRMQRSTSASARNGKADGCPCCDVFELEDGKIKRFYRYPERSVIFAQLGVTNREAALTR